MRPTVFLDSCSICGAVSREGSVRLVIGPGGGRICMACAAEMIWPVMMERFARTTGGLLLEKRSANATERCDICDYTAQYVGDLTGADIFKICRRDAARVVEIFLSPIELIEKEAPVPESLPEDRIRCGACDRILNTRGQAISIDAEPLEIINPDGPELRMYPIFLTPDGMLHKCHRWHSPSQEQRERWQGVRADQRHRLPRVPVRGLVVS